MGKSEEIDIDLIKNIQLFENIQAQKNIFLNLFTEIANQFPQSILIQAHKNSKGTKVSQGINLENCPYQVLDIFRDFDLKNGLNLRILNWWGHGLFLTLQFGEYTVKKDLILITENFKNYHVSNSKNPFDYPKLIKPTQLLEKIDIEKHLLKFKHLLIFIKIPYFHSKEDQKNILIEEIEKLFKF